MTTDADRPAGDELRSSLAGTDSEIAHTRRLIDAIDDPWARTRLACLLVDRYEALGAAADPADLVEALAVAEVVLGGPSTVPPRLAGVTAGHAAYRLAAVTDEAVHLDTAIRHLDAALAGDPLDADDLPAATTLADLLVARYADSGELADLEVAGATLDRILGHQDCEPPLREYAEHLLATTTGERARRTFSDDPADRARADRAITLLTLDLTLDREPEDRGDTARLLGLLHGLRHWADGAAAELDSAIRWWTEALDRGTDDVGMLFFLGDALGQRHDRDGDPADREAAIRVLDSAVTRADPTDPDTADGLLTLGTLLRDRADDRAASAADPGSRAAADADLEAAIAHLSAARDARPRGDDIRLLATGRLASAYEARSGDDLRPHETVGLIRMLREVCTDDTDEWPVPQDRHQLMLQLASTVLQGRSLLGQWQPEYEEALEVLTALRAEVPPDGELLGLVDVLLATALTIRLGDRATAGTAGSPEEVVASLEEAVALLEEALTLPPADEGLRPVAHAMAGLSYWQMTVAAQVVAQRRPMELPPLSETIPVVRDEVTRRLLELAESHLARGTDLATAPLLTFVRCQLALAGPVGELPDDRLDLLIAEASASWEGAPGGWSAATGSPMLTALLMAERAGRHSDPGEFALALRQFRSSLRGTPAGHPMRPYVLTGVAKLLTSGIVPMAAVPDSHRDAVDAAVEAAGLTGPGPVRDETIDLLARTLLAVGGAEPAAVRTSRAVALLDAALDGSAPEPGPGRRALWTAGLGVALALRWRGGGAEADRDRAISCVDRVARTMAADHPDRGAVLLAAGQVFRTAAGAGPAGRGRPAGPEEAAAMIRKGREIGAAGTPDLAALDTAAALLESGLSVELPDETARPGHLTVLGRIQLERHRRTGDRATLDRAVDSLERAWTPDPSGESAGALVALAAAYRARGGPGDAVRAIETAHTALRDYATAILVRGGVEERLALARTASAELAEQIGWCLADGDLRSAVVLLEAGRGLLLYAATMSVTVPTALRQAGATELAASWDAAADQDAIKRQALTVLTSTSYGMRLLSPTDQDEVAQAAWTQGADGLVYLVPASAGGPGRALLVRSNTAVTCLDLPLLDVGAGSVLSACTAARVAFFGAPHPADPVASPAGRQWLDSLERLCDWAWEAAVGPLVELVAGWSLRRPARLVVVPTGPLAAVPWHAARRTGPDGRHRYACADLVLSYAASARLLAEAVGRPEPRQPRAAFVAPSPTALWASIGARAIRDTFHPDARFLGFPRAASDAAGTPAEVLDLLPAPGRPAASPLQISTHALAASPPTESCLELSGGRLSVREILDQAARRPADAPGGLVICDACATDLTEQDHDEALTLGTAFLAAGYGGAIGTRWPVGDRTTAVLSFVLHDRLRRAGLQPADALRSTQLWALDPDREPPAGMPPALARYVTQPDLVHPWAWAAFVHQGR